MPLISVPYLSQWSSIATRFRSDCGPASVAMLLAFLGKLGGLTIDDLAAETGLRVNDVGLTTAQIVELGMRHGLPCRVNSNTTLEQIRQEIDAGRPVIALIKYGYISRRLDQGYYNGHFLVITGYVGDQFVTNDPDWYGGRMWEGSGFRIPATELDRALSEMQYGRQCVFMGTNRPLPVPDPLIGVAAVIDGPLNIRATPNGTILRQLPTGAGVEVLDVQDGWAKIKIEVYAYASTKYLKSLD